MTNKPKQPRLDVDFGLLLPLVKDAAAAEGVATAQLVRELVRDGLAARSFLKDRVREAVQALAEAIEPDERYDPADDPRESQSLGDLARLLGSAYAAQGVAEALILISVERMALKALKEDHEH